MILSEGKGIGRRSLKRGNAISIVGGMTWLRQRGGGEEMSVRVEVVHIGRNLVREIRGRLTRRFSNPHAATRRFLPPSRHSSSDQALNLLSISRGDEVVRERRRGGRRVRKGRSSIKVKRWSAVVVDGRVDEVGRGVLRHRCRRGSRWSNSDPEIRSLREKGQKGCDGLTGSIRRDASYVECLYVLLVVADNGRGSLTLWKGSNGRRKDQRVISTTIATTRPAAEMYY